MTRTARIWITGGREHDDEFRFEDILDFFEQLEDLQARRQVGLCKLHLHGDLQKLEYFTLPKGDVELVMIPFHAQGIILVMPHMFLDCMWFFGGVVLHESIAVPNLVVLLFIFVLGLVTCLPTVVGQLFHESPVGHEAPARGLHFFS